MKGAELIRSTLIKGHNPLPVYYAGNLLLTLQYYVAWRSGFAVRIYIADYIVRPYLGNCHEVEAVFLGKENPALT